MDKSYDFAGWVTKNDIKCSDGVTIRHNAFIDNDNQKVPLVWGHNHNTPSNVIGHVLLQNRPIGVYGYGFFNGTQTAQDAKELVRHGDVEAMSIGANRIKRTSNNDVIHGNIYEVSLVVAGANPGAFIDSVVQHSDSEEGEAVLIYTDNLIHSADYPDDEDLLEHAEDEETEETETETEAADDSEDPEELIEEIVSALSREEIQKIVKYARKYVDSDTPDSEVLNNLDDDATDDVIDYIMNLLEGSDEKDVKHSYYYDDEEEYLMRSNVFDRNMETQNALELEEIRHSMIDDLRNGRDTLQGVINYHSDELVEHGITDIDQLFTVENDTGAPGWIRPEEPSLVAKLIGGMKKTPNHTVHGRWADITNEEARARGYIKGRQKLEEVFSLLNRKTYPQTVYKKQSFDRDDWVDITDFDLIAWIKPEMKEMLQFELARAAFIGDGRATNSADKIDETHIRPIATDTEDNLFATKVGNVTAANFVEKVKKNRRKFKGSGQPSLYIDIDLLTDIECIKDDEGRYLYGVGNRPATDEDVAKLVGCKETIAPEFMDGTGLAIIVNLADYELACPAKGAATMFDDFDIDFNKMKYLIETRVAGALNRPKAAVIYSTETIAEVEEGNGD